MAFLDSGEGQSIVFLHGNPASSFLWRNITPSVEGLGRIVVPDLIGMGDSEKLEGKIILIINIMDNINIYQLF